MSSSTPPSCGWEPHWTCKTAKPLEGHTHTHTPLTWELNGKRLNVYRKHKNSVSVCTKYHKNCRLTPQIIAQRLFKCVILNHLSTLGARHYFKECWWGRKKKKRGLSKLVYMMAINKAPLQIKHLASVAVYENLHSITGCVQNILNSNSCAVPLRKCSFPW